MLAHRSANNIARNNTLYHHASRSRSISLPRRMASTRSLETLAYERIWQWSTHDGCSMHRWKQVHRRNGNCHQAADTHTHTHCALFECRWVWHALSAHRNLELRAYKTERDLQNRHIPVVIVVATQSHSPSTWPPSLSRTPIDMEFVSGTMRRSSATGRLCPLLLAALAVVLLCVCRTCEASPKYDDTQRFVCVWSVRYRGLGYLLSNGVPVPAGPIRTTSGVGRIEWTTRRRRLPMQKRCRANVTSGWDFRRATDRAHRYAIYAYLKS